ncbi:MAG: hypothetical protein DRP02_02335 [Candidatus Gerdarchaeota archaeon]|nr:MAG: hypothetical protein DRP02_02335 [Candidatus Gerdarchaeota archaeon]
MAKHFIELESQEWLNVRCICKIGKLVGVKVELDLDNGKRIDVTEEDAEKIKTVLRKERSFINFGVVALIFLAGFGLFTYSTKPQPDKITVVIEETQEVNKNLVHEVRRCIAQDDTEEVEE